MAKASKKEPQRNVEINETTWRNIGSLASLKGKTKKDIVTEALDFFFHVEMSDHKAKTK